ncbi:major histocompatibility complex class I-related gene protein-like [Myripristis murdjan]|uniref:major histocompatibility complex class I-related gene protein-like n=1 Tax=Myripristis murdjan TaxID=586833 RepID=UPI0011764628|nr:major histocompatibility complex class I-related gene protein-like [Myripristis murdjan]
MLIQWIILFIANFLVPAGECDSHTLEFLSVGLAQPGGQSRVTQQTVFDRIPVSYCDSFTKKEEPKQILVSKNILSGSCGAAHDDILEALSVIPAFINSTLYVIQRRRGCSLSGDGNVSAFEAWAVNGMDFLTFDPHSLEWISQSQDAASVRLSWNNNKRTNLVFSYFIRTECPLLIKRLKLKTPSQTPKTELHIFAKAVSGLDKVSLRCHVTSNEESVSTVHLIGGAASRVTVTGQLPSGDGGLVMRLAAEISPGTDWNKYGCRIQTSIHNITVMWDEQKPRPPPSIDPQVRQQATSLLENEVPLEPKIVILALLFGGQPHPFVDRVTTASQLHQESPGSHIGLLPWVTAAQNKGHSLRQG